MSPIPDSDADARILATLRAHERTEGTALSAYRRLVEQHPDEGIRYLGRIIVADEERHHRLSEEITHRVESWQTGVDVESSTPQISPHLDPDLLAATHRMIELEREDAEALRRLERELRYVPATSLVRLLVDLMLDDTHRHIKILRFITTYTG